ncbi:single-stranded DNA-binding protein [Opitutia bacterium KCR 482]|nr:single-stranded DNA-binding protein [Opitutae bacterium KCR 482]MDY5583197.1 single-stranded DNA-binding protein [Candidatus Merdousia sp.]
MSSFNKVILMGNLTRDPELRQTQNGTSVCRFAIAVNRSFNSQDGSLRDETCFVEIDCFGKSAENIARFFTKGKPILVEGRLRQDTWEDKQTGQKRTKLMVVLERFEFVGGRDSGGNGGYDAEYSAPQPRGGARQAPRQQRAPSNDDIEDDDVPF